MSSESTICFGKDNYWPFITLTRPLLPLPFREIIWKHFGDQTFATHPSECDARFDAEKGGATASAKEYIRLTQYLCAEALAGRHLETEDREVLEAYTKLGNLCHKPDDHKLQDIIEEAGKAIHKVLKGRRLMQHWCDTTSSAVQALAKAMRCEPHDRTLQAFNYVMLRDMEDLDPENVVVAVEDLVPPEEVLVVVKEMLAAFEKTCEEYKAKLAQKWRLPSEFYQADDDA